MKKDMNNKLIPNTDITLKQFKKLLYERFKAYPYMRTDYKNNTFTVRNTFYDNIDITQRKLSLFCNKLGIKHKKYYSEIVIDLE